MLSHVGDHKKTILNSIATNKRPSPSVSNPMAQTVTLTLDQQGDSTSIGTVRSHSVTVDRPASKGGADQGPMGGELLLVGLGGCFMSNLLAAIKSRNAPISQVKTVVSGTIDGNPAHFTAYSLQVSAKHEDRALLEKLVTIAERGCISANSLKKAAPVSVSIVDLVAN